MKKKIRPLGNITSDLEVLLEEAIDDHDLQCGEVMALVYSWIRVHRPSAVEEYLDGSRPVFFYGPSREE